MNTVKMTGSGPVSGIEDGGSIVYKGIPYAMPPIGELRFSAPQDMESWNEVKICDKWPADAYRCEERAIKAGHTYSEDCLYLNIWIPKKVSDEGLPVMVWLYGAMGSSHDDFIDGHRYNEKGCILVSINYRIGIFGNFGLEEFADKDPNGSTGAYGIMDIVQALRWVQKNISAFGGDPDNVTVFGHSAGAMFTKLLLGCKSARGLFRRVISLSGGGIWDIDYIHTKESKCSLCRQILENAGWTAEDMMTRSVEEIYEVVTREENKLPLPKTSMISTLFQPSMDDYLITDYYGQVLYDGDIDEDADIMCGMLSEEWHNFIHQVPGGVGGYEREFAMASIIAWARRNNERGIKPAYTYFFERSLPDGQMMRHGDELVYVFGTMETKDQAWTKADRYLSDLLVSYFTNFAKTGDPNEEGLPKWEPFESGTELTMYFSQDSAVSENISGYEKAEAVTGYIMDHPGILNGFEFNPGI